MTDLNRPRLRLLTTAVFLTGSLAIASSALLSAEERNPGSAEEKDPELPGQQKSTKIRALEAGSTLMQTDAPAAELDIHLVGMHPLKADPQHQMDVHHFCHQMTEGFAQCALFDGDGEDARLTGIEYIISASVFETLPEEEKRYWHPHNYEILSGTLVAPGIPAFAEQELMQSKVNSYGKTWHTWNTGLSNTPADELPLGEPKLGWSLNRDGEADPELLQRRWERLEMDPVEVRESRQALVPYAEPQSGVDALKGQFGRETRPIEGVEDKEVEDKAR